MFHYEYNYFHECFTMNIIILMNVSVYEYVSLGSLETVLKTTNFSTVQAKPLMKIAQGVGACSSDNPHFNPRFNRQSAI